MEKSVSDFSLYLSSLPKDSLYILGILIIVFLICLCYLYVTS